MKKITMLLGLCCMSVGMKLIAQDTTIRIDKPRADFSRGEIGLRFMPTFSAFDMETSAGGTIKGEVTLGYGFGGMMGYNFSNHIGMQVELLYSSLAQKYKDEDLDREINLRYINIPLLISLNTGKANMVNLNVVAGPQMGFNIGSSIKGTGGSNTDTVTYVLATKKGDFGFAYGAGLGFILNEAKSVRLDVGFRGVYGFVNISDSNNPPQGDAVFILDRAKVRTAAGYLGVTFLF